MWMTEAFDIFHHAVPDPMDSGVAYNVAVNSLKTENEIVGYCSIVFEL